MKLDANSLGLGGVILVFIILFALACGFSALSAWVVMLLWNYIAVATHHAAYQITFWVALAGTVLLSLIAKPFRVVVRKSEE